MVIIMYGCGKLIFVFLSCILLYIYIYICFMFGYVGLLCIDMERSG